MKVEYLICDLCGVKIDFEKGDKAAGKIEIARIRSTFGKSGSVITPLSPFYSERVGELANKDVVEKVYIDTCEKCSKLVEDFCTETKKKQTPEDFKKKDNESDSK